MFYEIGFRKENYIDKFKGHFLSVFLLRSPTVRLLSNSRRKAKSGSQFFMSGRLIKVYCIHLTF